MNDIPGVIILDKTIEYLQVPISDYHFGLLQVLLIALALIVIFGGSFFLTSNNINPFLFLITILGIGGIGAFLLVAIILTGYKYETKPITTYTVTLNETTPYLALQDYEFIKVEDNIYTFKDKIPYGD